MKTIKFKKYCRFNGTLYDVGDELKHPEKVSIDSIRSLNEKGFIEPLTQKELSQIEDGSFFNETKIKVKKLEEE